MNKTLGRGKGFVWFCLAKCSGWSKCILLNPYRVCFCTCDINTSKMFGMQHLSSESKVVSLGDRLKVIPGYNSIVL